MTGVRRRAYEAGHRPKFMAVVDETPECDRAVYFAARRSARTGAGLVLLCVVPPADFNQWIGVGELMQAEAEEESRKRLDAMAARAAAVSGVAPQLELRIGSKADEMLALILADEDIALLVLAAGEGSEGPGPLVAALAGRSAGSFPIPVAIVPGHLTDPELDSLA